MITRTTVSLFPENQCHARRVVLLAACRVALIQPDVQFDIREALGEVFSNAFLYGGDITADVDLESTTRALTVYVRADSYSRDRDVVERELREAKKRKRGEHGRGMQMIRDYAESSEMTLDGAFRLVFPACTRAIVPA